MDSSDDAVQCYKVVTEDMRSLGLRGNENILTYAVGRWTAEQTPIHGPCGEGGIWAAKTLRDARKIEYYMLKQHKTKTKVFESCGYGVLYSSPCMMKLERIKLLEEVLR